MDPTPIRHQARAVPLRLLLLLSVMVLQFASVGGIPLAAAGDRLEFQPPSQDAPSQDQAKHVVLIAGDEEYRTEETMPMLAKLLSQRHGFRCTVLFSFGPDAAEYIDPNNPQGLRGLEALRTADLMIIGTRFRTPDAAQARHITDFLNAGKPVIGIRTATHAFQGDQTFGDSLSYDDFGRRILGEQWVSHHGAHKRQGALSVPEKSAADHPILRGLGPIFAPSDVYGVIHLTEADKVLLRAAVTESLEPGSKPVAGKLNDPMQPFAWLHTYTSPDGQTQGTSFCTTGGASVDFVDEDLRRLIVNAAYFLTGQQVPEKARVDFVDPFYPSFYGFIREPGYWKNANLRPEDFGLGRSPHMPDPPGSPQWDHRPQPNQQPPSAAAPEAEADTDKTEAGAALPLYQGERLALVGNSLAERMNLFGTFETMLHAALHEKQLRVRNFGWPADEVALQQRPGNYTEIDDPLEVFSPQLFLCFFGFNESFRGRDADALQRFQNEYRTYIADKIKRFTQQGRAPRFVLISPIAFESSGDPLQPSGEEANQNLQAYSRAIQQLAEADGHRFVDLFTPTSKLFAAQRGAQYTINGVHLNEPGDRAIGRMLFTDLIGDDSQIPTDSRLERLRAAVNDKSWLHLQDYRMLNGWYVYGGRRTWDTETFPAEYRKIRNMKRVRDQYIWDIAAGRPVPDQPDDSGTGEVVIPETMFGTRDDNFRKMREPTTLVYPTPEQSIHQMTVPEGFEVQLFASEREFPELANPTQINFDDRGRLWVSCMVSYPQWLPGTAKPSDRLLILEDTDGDGRADSCKSFYDKLACPTGFEFWNGGVLVVDEPRILFLKDHDGDDVADEVVHLVDGIATDDTHHTMGAWEFSHGGLLHMLEGVSMSTTLETPWGPFRNHGPSGAYVWDPLTLKIRHFRTPGYGNPWCMVFDQWGNGIIGDGTNAQQHWATPLSGAAVQSRRTLRPIFDNQGMRPAVGNDFLISRHFPDEVQGQFIYGCVINMHGFPRFTVRDEEDGAGLTGERIEDLLSSTDMFFRPVDPHIGPDGALWFGDWCNALIGHMQYSQRDPNRDHEHGRVYRMVYKGRDLLQPVTQAHKSVPELLDQLTEYELRTRYRARRALRDRPAAEVLSAVDRWIDGVDDPRQLCEALWIQESFRQIRPALLNKILASADFHARAAAVHTASNEHERIDGIQNLLAAAVGDPHPRVRVEALRGLSFLQTAEAAEIALKVHEQPVDYWIQYTLEHTLQALQPAWSEAERQGQFLVNAPDALQKAFLDYKHSTGPGAAIYKPLKLASNVDAPMSERRKAVAELAAAGGGNAQRGTVVFERVCAACHQFGDKGKEFGPKLTDIGSRMTRRDLIESIVWPNDKIAKGFETVMILTVDGRAVSGFILKEDAESISLGVANGKVETIDKDDIELREEKKASSMPEGLSETVAPIEFLDLIEYLTGGWIDTEDPQAAPLRTHGSLKEISRAARLRLGDDYPGHWNQQAGQLLNGKHPGDRDFAFHSPEGQSSPAVVIALPEPAEIGHVWIQNRVNPQFHGRAEGLTMWVSRDGQQWTEVWKAAKPQAEWSVDLPAGTQAQWIKLGLVGKGTLHLNQVALFGP